jgi:hypothetical protein
MPESALCKRKGKRERVRKLKGGEEGEREERQIAENNNQSEDICNLFERIHLHCIYIMCIKLE